MNIATLAPPAGSSPSNGAGPSSEAFKPIEAITSPSTFSANTTPFFSAVQNTAVTKGPLELLTEFYQSPIPSSLLDVAAAAGGAATPYPLKAIGDVSTAAKVVALYQKGDYLGIGEIATSEITTTAAGAAGGPIGAAVAQGALEVGTKVVAPWLGGKMYELSPSTFTP